MHTHGATEAFATSDVQFTPFCIKWRIANNCLYPHVREQQSLSRFQFTHFQQNTAGKSRSQNTTIQDAPRKGRNWTSGGLLPSALPRQGQAPLQPPVAVSRLSPLAGTALRHQLSLAPLKSPQSYWVCLCNQITVDWLLTLTAGPSFQTQQTFSSSRNSTITRARHLSHRSPSEVFCAPLTYTGGPRLESLHLDQCT